MIWAYFMLLTAVVGAVYCLFFSPSFQLFGRVNSSFKSDGKQIALTFDDGPNEPHTSDLLKILADNNVKATFFMCGRCIEKYPDIVKKIHQAGHTIGNHSHSHTFSHYLNLRAYLDEVNNTSNLLQKITGSKPKYYRSPWLFRTPGLLRAIRSNNMLPIWGYFGSELEVFQPSPRNMAKRALQVSRPGRILILHDGREARGGFRGNTVEAVGLLIPTLKDQGYSFVTIDEVIVS